MKIKKSLVLVLLISLGAHAQKSLKMDGDLMLHPQEMAALFNIAADEIKNSPGWSWPAMDFTQPYKTSWSQVDAQGPFDIQFDTANMANQEWIRMTNTGDCP